MASPNTPPPPISPALVEWLQAAFPDRLPRDISTPPREVAYQIGQQSVIRKLQDASERQNILET